MMPAQTRSRPEPADDPGQTTFDPSSTPVEDLPAPERSEPESGPIRTHYPDGEPIDLDAIDLDRLRRSRSARDEDLGQYAPDQGRSEALGETIPGAFAETEGPVFGRRLPELPDSAYPPGAVELEAGPPLTAAEALVEVMRRVQPIRKWREAEPKAGGYSFRGIDDVYDALHDLFAEYGLVLLPSTLEHEREQRPRASGSGYNYVTHVRVRLRFLAADGTYEDLDVWGEGADTGDKSTGKAYSQGVKSALLLAFLIPTGESAANDPDATNSDPSRPFTPQEVERASTALGAARDARTLEDLVRVGRRANAGGLLDVPLTAGGTLAPLRFHLDALRAALESRVADGQQS